MPRYEKRDRESGKFWEIALKGRVISTRAGKVGAGISRDQDGQLFLYDRRGRATDRELPTLADARREYAKLIAAKRREGFVLVDGSEPDPGTPPPPSLEDPTLEAAIAAAPDDLATYLVYADWLLERGDPLGELITVQHGMRGQQDPAAFMTFKKRERELRARHARAWLGDAADYEHRLKLDWRAGFVHKARVSRPHNATELALGELVAVLLAARGGRFVRDLAIHGAAGEALGAVPSALPPALDRLRLLLTEMPAWLMANHRDDLDGLRARCGTAGVALEIVEWGYELEPGRYVASHE